MNYYYRKLNSKDLNSVWELIEILKSEKCDMSFTDFNSKEEIITLIDNPAYLTYVAISKKEPQRVLSLVMGRRNLSKEKSHAAFLSAATHPNARGKELASKLTNYALKQMKQKRVNIARIYVYSNNKASLNATKKLGFVHAGTILRHHIDPATSEYVDDIIFHKILN